MTVVQSTNKSNNHHIGYDAQPASKCMFAPHFFGGRFWPTK